MLDFLTRYNIDDDVLAAGVSGGADSLALVLQLDECLRPIGKRVVALTVNHGLRPEAAAEADYVHRLMAKYGIEHHILVWKGEKPQTGIEEAARTARYGLLREWCEEHGVRCLCTAHHAFDQAETFLLRLQRGSGLTGLCGMQPVSNLNGLTILRPLLHTHPDALKKFLCERNIEWINDASNQCDDFLRVRMRKFLPEFERATGITPQRLVETMSVLSRSRDYIHSQTEKFIRQHVKFWDNAGVSVFLSLLAQQHEEMRYRVLSELIKRVGGRIYTPRADDTERLLSVALETGFRGATLGGCEVFPAQGKLWIVPELKQKTRLPKKVWDMFVLENPSYAKIRLPYKLRAVLVKSKMNVEF